MTPTFYFRQQEFSQRSQVISKVVEPSMTPKQVDLLVKKTRLKKFSDYEDEVSIREWECRADKYGFVWEEVGRQIQSQLPQQQQQQTMSRQSTPQEATKPPSQEVRSFFPPSTLPQPKKQPRASITTPRQREQFYRKLATELQTSQPKRGFRRSFLQSKILEQSKGTYEEAQVIAHDFERSYTRPSRVKSRLRLNFQGHRLIDFGGIRRRIANTIRRIWEIHKKMRNFGTSVKMLYLYATGKISRKQWLIICRRKELYRLRYERKITRERYVLALDELRKKNKITPDHLFLVRSYEAAGLLSHKNSQYWGKILLEAKKCLEEEKVKRQLSQWERRSLEIGEGYRQSQIQNYVLQQQ